jgi:hypothetical protein
MEVYEVSKNSTAECVRSVRSEDISGPDLAEGVRKHWFRDPLKIHCSMNSLLTLIARRLTPLQPSGHYMYRQFNIQQFYVLPTQCICVLCGYENKQRLFPYAALTGWFL